MLKFAVKSAFFVLVFSLTYLIHSKTIFAYTTGMDASLVLGQPNFSASSANNGGINAASLNNPRGIAIAGQKLIVSDGGNHRILIWNSMPTSNRQQADVVIGQTNFGNNSENQGGSVAANTLASPRGLDTDGTKLFVSDQNNQRVLIFNQIPTSNNASADIVIGQANLTSSTQDTKANRMFEPSDVDYDPVSGKLIVADKGNKRVLVFNSVPTSHNASAAVVVGQPDFTSNNSACTAAGFDEPIGAQIVEGKLMAADVNQYRSLIWNAIPTQNGTSADLVLGQSSFTSCGDLGTNANTIFAGQNFLWDGKRFFVSDQERILIFNQIPTANRPSAYMAIGQQNLQNQDSTPVTASSLAVYGCSSAGAHTGLFENKLIVADSCNNRVLIYNNIIQNPKLTINNSEDDAPGGLLRMKGRVTVDSLYSTQKVECSVNSDIFHAAKAVDESFNSNAENFYCDIDPRANSNKLPGYTLRIKAQNTNMDETDSLFFFTPFNLHSPSDKQSSATTLPTFEFSVNKQRTRMRDDLQKYQVQIAKVGTENWKTYIDDIPVDFESAKNLNDNLQRLKYTGIAINNGIFDTKFFTAVYSDDSSRIKITPKDIVDVHFPLGKKLALGSYKWKIVATDKVGHTQSTGIRTLTVTTLSSTKVSQGQQNIVQNITEDKITDQTGFPLPTPAPSPSLTQQPVTNNPQPTNLFCIWKICLPKIDLWPF